MIPLSGFHSNWKKNFQCEQEWVMRLYKSQFQMVGNSFAGMIRLDTIKIVWKTRLHKHPL